MSRWDEKRREYSKRNERESRVRGIGIGLTEHAISVGILSPDPGSAIVELDKDGKIVIKVALVELGQGVSTSHVQLVSRYLDIPMDEIKVESPNTQIMYDSGTTTASRGTVVGGKALKIACEKLRELMLEKAAEELNAPKEEIEFRNGIFRVKGKEMTLKELAYRCSLRGEKLHAEGWVDMHEGLYWDFEKGYGSPFPCYAYAAHVAEVEVDMETGIVNVIRYYAAHDSGKIINELTSKGQVYGGIIQGIGYALMEDLIIENGRIMNPTLLDYYIPTSLDIPDEVSIAFIEDHPWDKGPFGAKGLAEIGLNPVAATIGNAIFHAIGVPIRELPFTPEKVLSIIEKGVRK